MYCSDCTVRCAVTWASITYPQRLVLRHVTRRAARQYVLGGAGVGRKVRGRVEGVEGRKVRESCRQKAGEEVRWVLSAGFVTALQLPSLLVKQRTHARINLLLRRVDARKREGAQPSRRKYHTIHTWKAVLGEHLSTRTNKWEWHDTSESDGRSSERRAQLLLSAWLTIGREKATLSGLLTYSKTTKDRRW